MAHEYESCYNNLEDERQIDVNIKIELTNILWMNIDR